ncbi:MAG: TlpA family protein disulfide reductase [Candidatus Margulisbacteria bacterium]|jgi:peroxiredoxin|nr:TlpA family protein disulfide reductase [Candidatus Margulisiibacteriota bacterium]
MKRLLCGLCLTILCASLAAAEVAPKVGCQAPELRLSTLAGKPLVLSEQFGSKRIILTFFTSWSRSCQAALQTLNDLAVTHPATLQVVAVSFDKKSKELKNYLDQAALAFPVLHDKKLTTIDSFQILIIPTTFCLNRDGVIEQVFVDYDDNVKQALLDWLED